MKKTTLFSTLLFLLLATGVSAQLRLGGDVGLSITESRVLWRVSPVVGYRFNRFSLDLGLTVGGGDADQRVYYGAGLQVLYWIGIGNRFFYTPGLFVNYYHYSRLDQSIGLGVKLLKFEVRVSNRVYLGLDLGDLGYRFVPNGNNEFRFDLKVSPSIAVRYSL